MTKQPAYQTGLTARNLYVKKVRRVHPTTPAITLLDREKGFPITTENIKYGQRVIVLGMPCDPFWRTEAGIKQVGPRYFKYDVDYVSIDELVRESGK